MGESIIYRTDALVIVGCLFVLMLLAIFAGLKTGKARLLRNQEENSGNQTVVASLFGLLGFLLAFTFGMSGGRFDNRREAVVKEANAIGTALLRADLYPSADKDAFRKDFKIYIEARIQYFEAGRDAAKMNKAIKDAETTGKLLWDRATRLAQDKENIVQTNQMIPALNDMFDSATSRNIGEKARVPDSIVIMLFIMSVTSAFYVGYSAAGKGRLDWFIITGFCLLTAVVIYITLDLDRPRRGIIKVDSSQQAMLDLRNL